MASSSFGNKRTLRWINVTSVPAAAKTPANSVPMGPPPNTANRLYGVFGYSLPNNLSLVMYPASSKPST